MVMIYIFDGVKLQISQLFIRWREKERGGRARKSGDKLSDEAQDPTIAQSSQGTRAGSEIPMGHFTLVGDKDKLFQRRVITALSQK